MTMSSEVDPGYERLGPCNGTDLVLRVGECVRATLISPSGSLHSGGSPHEITLTADENSTGWNSSNSTLEQSFGGAVPQWIAILVPIIFAIVVILGCVGNTLVFVVVVKNRTYYRNTTNIFILNLAFADLLFLVFCVPFHAVIYTLNNWPFGQFMCKFVHFVQYLGMIASVLTLVCMATDRYLAVAYPLKTKHLRTPPIACAAAVTVWILAIAGSVVWPILYTIRVYTNLGPNPMLILCADDWGSRSNRAIYFLFLFICGFLIPLIIIIVMSVLMVIQLWATPTPEPSCNRSSFQQKRKVTRMVIVLVAIFLMCWFPFHLTYMWISFSYDTWERTYAFFYLRVFARVLSYANSCLNPIIYAFMSQNFRRGFQKALHCGKRSLIIPEHRSMYSVSQSEMTTNNVTIGNTTHFNHTPLIRHHHD
ncbi:galanin receptor 2a-like [Lineus longissimus]|uniref:galanin receptor 2a-like n=1 Tax=Lineus longissimus TaxID=88925 RepID=UPI002B4E1A7E